MFPSAYVISLRDTPDRLAAFRQRASAAGLHNVRHFPGARMPRTIGGLCEPMVRRPGLFGCNVAHHAAISMLMANGTEGALIMEDDAVFAEGFVESAWQSIGELPAEWDLLFLGAMKVFGATPVAGTQTLHRATLAWGTHCYMANPASAGRILDVIETFSDAIDVNLTTAKGLNTFFRLPSISWQADEVSTIDGKTLRLGNADA